MNISTKLTSASDSTYVDITQQLAQEKNISHLITTINGVTYIQYGSTDWFATDKTFGKGVTYRFRSVTRYVDDVKTCFTNMITITGVVISAGAVFTYSEAYDRPKSWHNPGDGSHTGNVTSISTRGFLDKGVKIGRDSTVAEHGAYAFGIASDNVPHVRVTGVHQKVANDNKGAIGLQQQRDPVLPVNATYPYMQLKINGSTDVDSNANLYNPWLLAPLPSDKGTSKRNMYIGESSSFKVQSNVVLHQSVYNGYYGLSPQKLAWQPLRLKWHAAGPWSGNKTLENVDRFTRIITRAS